MSTTKKWILWIVVIVCVVWWALDEQPWASDGPRPNEPGEAFCGGAPC
jgi:hypothetical protein